MVLRIVRYSNEGTWGTVGQYWVLFPTGSSNIRIIELKELFCPQEPRDAWEKSSKTDADWEAFKDAVRPTLIEKRPELIKLIKEINSRQDNYIFNLLVPDGDYDHSWEWCVEQWLSKGFSISGQRYQINHRVEQVGLETVTVTPDHITSLLPHQIFVFGSNTEGRHGKGAAKAAMAFGANYGQAKGLQGQTYAIVTKDLTKGERSIPLEYIRSQISELFEFASANPDKEFLVTKLGCSLAGYSIEEIAPLWFQGVLPSNIKLPEEFMAFGTSQESIVTLEEPKQTLEEIEVCTEIPTITEVQEDKVTSASTVPFVPLHCHSHYSDGSAKVKDLVEKAIQQGSPAIALTDHGTMMGSLDLYEACKQFGIKPIIGNEMYLEHPLSALLATKPLDGLTGDYKPGNRFHQIVLAKTLEGYKNLSRLTTWSELHNKKAAGGKGKAYPLITFEKLKEFSEGLIVTSGCIGSLVPQLIIHDEYEEARKIASEYKEVFGEDYYIELQSHDSQKIYSRLNRGLIKLGRELGIEFVVTPDTHYLNACDYEFHQVLYCIKYGKKLSELDQEKFHYDRDLFLADGTDLKSRFTYLTPDERDKILDSAITNTVKLADKVQHYELYRSPTAPEFPLPTGVTAEAHLRTLAEEGLEKRLEVIGRLAAQGKIKNWNQELVEVYRERLNYELDVLHQKGFESYFLFVHDCIAFAKSQDIPTGAGRGSAAGSLVCYALEITNIDPVYHGLLFERFLNPERKSMPDIDSDFCQERRGEVVDYVITKYGRDKVAQIGTYNRLTSKAVVKEVARVLDLPIADSKLTAKLIPVRRGNPEKLKNMIAEDSPSLEFRDRYRKEPEFKNWIDIAMNLEGNVKTYGTHAAGIVISDTPLSEWVPLMKTKEDGVCTQYDMNQIEKMGFIKMDFLGLKNLTIVKKALDMIKENRGQIPDMERLDLLEDDKVYDLYRTGETDGIFQFESSGMKAMLKDLKPDNIEDLSGANALFRPGALDAGEVPLFINRKHGRQPMEYMIPELEPILSSTYACLVYQEQALKIAQDISDYTLGQADNLRRCIGKKKTEEIKKEAEKFVQGAIAKGQTKEIAEKLFQFIEYQSGYSFNKSHSLSYAYQSLACALLKAHYSAEYMSALMSYQDGQDKRDKVSKYLNKCRDMGIKILPPDINTSKLLFTPNGDDILFGFKTINRLGEVAITNILDARESEKFTDIVDFYQRTGVNSTGLQSLTYSGAFDSLHSNRKQLISAIPLLKEWKANLLKLPERIARIQESLAKRYEKLKIEPTLEALDAYEQAYSPLKKTKQEHVNFIRKKQLELLEVKEQFVFTLPEMDEDFTFEEKLRQEQDAIGFFISGNPLDDLEQQDLFPVMPDEDSEEELYIPKFKDSFTVACTIVEREKPKTAKTGKLYQLCRVEDHAGTSMKCLLHDQVVEDYGNIIDESLTFVGVFGLKLEDEEYTAFLREVL
jgi:DNA polymerase-3 subunit alpha